MAVSYSEQVQQAYLAYYGRPADPAGQAYWTQQLTNANGNLNAIINAFGTSAESTALYAGSSLVAQVNAIYNQLFNHNADTAGLAFYVNGLQQGTYTLASIALNIFNGAAGTDIGVLAAKQAYADAFTLQVAATTAAQVAYSGTTAANNARADVAAVTSTATEATAVAALATSVASIGSATGTGTGPAITSFTLTTGVDNITLTGNSVVNGVLGALNGVTGVNPSTLSALDTISATGTNNTLNISDLSGGTALPAGISVSGVQTVNLTAAGVGAAPLAGDNFTGFTGLTTLNVKEIGGTGTGAGFTAAGTTAVNLTDVAQAAGNISVLGGSNVAVTATGDTTGTVTVGSTTAAPTGTIAVTVSDLAAASGSTAGGQITTTGGTAVAVTENIAAATSVIGNAYTTTGGAVNINGTATTTSASVSQTAAVAAVAGAAATGGTFAVHSVAFSALPTTTSVTLGGITVNAGASTLTPTLLAAIYAAEPAGGAALATAIANAVAASVGTTVTGTWVGGFSATNAVPGTAVFTATTVGIGAGFTVTGAPAAVDTFSAGTAAVTAATAAVGGIADGFVTVADVNFGSTTKAGTITTVSLNNFSTGATINDTGLTSLTLAGTGGAVAINEAGSLATQAVTTLNLNANAVTGAAAAVTDAGIKTLNVVTGGAAASTLAFNDAALTTLNVSGTQSINLTQNATALAAINVSGGAGVTATIGASTVFAATGTGNDVVTLNGALTKTSGGSISFGSGNNSLLAGTAASIASGVTVNGGTGGLNTISASLVNAGNAAGISNFQVLDVSNFGSGAGNGSLDASLMGSPVSGVAISSAVTNGTATLLNLGSAVTVTDSANGSSSNLVLTHSAGAGTLAVNFADAATTAPVTSTIASLISTGDTSISVSSLGVKGAANAITNIYENDNHLTTVTITGSNAFTLGGVHSNDAVLTATANIASTLTTIDGSAATGALNITAGGNDQIGVTAFNTTYNGLTIKGGIGGDTIVNHAASGVIIEGATAATLVNNLTVDGTAASINDAASAGTDVINLSGLNGSATLGSGNGVIVNVIDDAAAKLSDVTTVTYGSGTANVNDNLAYHVTASATSAATNGDILVLNGSLHANSLSFAAVANTGALGAATSIAAAQTFDQAVFAGQSATANTVTWFQFGGNTYVENSGATASTADNSVVKIAGVVDLSHATVAANHVTFA